MRIKRHTQIAINLFAADLIKETGGKEITADAALWEYFVRTNPKLAETASEKAQEEGHPPPKPIK